MNFDSLKKMVATIGTQKKTLAQEIEGLKQERETLQALPRSRGDLAEMMDRWLLAQRSTLLEVLRKNLDGLILNSDKVSPAGKQAIFCRQSILGEQVLSEGVLLSLLLPVSREQMRQAIKDLPNYPEEVGPPTAERNKRLAALDTEIAALETTLQEIDDEANAAGLSLDGAGT